VTAVAFPPAEAPERSRAATFHPVTALLVGVAVGLLSYGAAVAIAVISTGLLDPTGLSGFLDELGGPVPPSETSVAGERIQGFAVAAAGCVGVVLLLGGALLARRAGVRHVLAIGGTLARKPLLIALAFMTATLVAETVAADFYPHLRELFTLPFEPLAFAVTVFGVVIAAPVSEELLFRGLLYTSVRERWGFWPALILTSTLFAALHYEPTGVYALLVLPSAFLFGWLREVTGGVYASTLMHAAFNTAAVAGLLVERAMGGG
jgi:membrane protease YdiL (CAAX protease family)